LVREIQGSSVHISLCVKGKKAIVVEEGRSDQEKQKIQQPILKPGKGAVIRKGFESDCSLQKQLRNFI